VVAVDTEAAGGLRYTNFHTTALCSPSRAALMAGRNPHRIGLGSHSLTAMGFPGYNGFPPESAKFTFTKTGLGQGVGTLSVNGAQVAETTMPKMHLSTFSLSETFDVGVDLGSPVSPSYGSRDPHFPYTGVLDKVTITLTGDDTDRAKEVDGTAELD
jgi:hypothetical protein